VIEERSREERKGFGEKLRKENKAMGRKDLKH